MKKILNLPAVAGLLCVLPVNAQMTVEEMEQLDFGFQVFTEEEFDGNGRTCSTCHLPEEQYNIAPSDIAAMDGDELAKVLASNVPGLENTILVVERGLFNVEGGPHEEGGPAAEDDAEDCNDGHECEGPVFRGSMTVGPFGLTTGAPGVPGLPSPALGWAANGSPTPASPGGSVHHGFFDPDADGSTRAFAAGAVAQHFTTCLERTNGTGTDADCFRRPTAEELDALDAFQHWLGRRDEFDIGLMTFSDYRADAGRSLYMENELGCNVCHGNGGSQFLGGANGNINQHSDVDEERHQLAAKTGVFIPEDEGIAVDPPGPQPLSAGAFNIQPVIEAVRKGEIFFHNSAVFTPHGSGIETAMSFYFREPFLSSDIHAALHGLQAGGGGDGSGNVHLDSAEELFAFAGRDVRKNVGAFTRALAAFYSVRDCERLVQETIDRIAAGVSPELPAMHCEFNLEDAEDVLHEARVRNLYRPIQNKARTVRRQLKKAVERNDVRRLERIMGDLAKMRNRIATTPELL